MAILYILSDVSVKEYIVALDEGTTSARTVVFDKAGNIVSMAQREFTQIYPQAGYVEQDATEIYACQYSTLTEAILGGGIDPKKIHIYFDSSPEVITCSLDTVEEKLLKKYGNTCFLK